MKLLVKKSFFLLALSLIFAVSKAQISFGPKVGLNLSMVKSNDPNIIIDPIVPAFNIGALVNYKFQIPIAVQAELCFSGEGTELKDKGETTVYHEKYGYMDIPLLFQFKPKGGFFLEAGPQFGILLYAKEEANGSTTDEKSYEHSGKISGCFGLGYQYKERFGIGVRYALAFTDIDKDETYTSKGNVLSVNFFYAFHIGSK